MNQQTVLRFLRAHSLVGTAVQNGLREYWPDAKMTMSPGRVQILFFLEHESMKMSDIAEKIGVRLSRATMLVDFLVKVRLVERYENGDDRRQVWCRLTETGREQVRGMLNALSPMMDPLNSTAFSTTSLMLETLAGGFYESA